MENSNRNCKGLRVLLRGPYPPPYGGIASLIVSLLPGLRDCGAEEVVVLHYGTKNAVETIAGATVYRYALKTQAWRILLPENWPTVFLVLSTFKGARLQFKQLVSETIKTILADRVAEHHRCNVVSFYQSNAALELLACKAKWGRARGLVLTVFGEIYDNSDFIKRRPELFRRLIESADAVLSSSEHCARSFKPIGVDRSIQVVYIGVDLQRFDDDGALRRRYRDQLKLSEDIKLLLFVGRFNTEMGLDSLIDIVPSLVQKNSQLKIILAGARGPLCDLALECQKKYPDHLLVMNDVPFDLLPSLYAASDIVLTPSREQHACMGVTIKEAMAASRPVIGSDSGGIPEAIVHGETGLIVPLDADGNVDHETYEEAILALVGDSQRCVEMGRKARLRAAELFSEELTLERVAEVFMRCAPDA
jgi:glycosyltransferase involved in cell wall biosynthesis